MENDGRSWRKKRKSPWNRIGIAGAQGEMKRQVGHQVVYYVL